MKDLSRHIEYLLCENDSVAIPSIGTFVTEELHARYYAEENLYLPPVRSVKLDTQQTEDDGKLENCLVQLHRVTHIVAKKWIADYVENINHSLMETGYMDMGTIGRLVFNNAQISFDVCEAGVNSPELYGLDSFHMAKLPPHAHKNRVYKDPTHFTIRLKRTTVHRVMAAAAMLVVILSVIVPNYEAINLDDKWQTQLASAESLKTLFTTNPMPIMPQSGEQGRQCQNLDQGATHTQQESKANTEQGNSKDTQGQLCSTEYIKNEDIALKSEPVVTETPSKVAEVVTNEQQIVNALPTEEPFKEQSLEVKGYCVVMASAVTNKGAEHLIKKLRGEGFNNAVKYKDKGMLRVLLTGYANEAGARADLAKVRSTDKLYSGSWIKHF